MSLATKRQLPNIYSDKIRESNSGLIHGGDDARTTRQNFDSIKPAVAFADKSKIIDSRSAAQRSRGSRLNSTDGKQSTLSHEHEISRRPHLMKQMSKRDSTDSIKSLRQDSVSQEIDRTRHLRRLQEIEREIQQHREDEQQRRLIASRHVGNGKLSPSRPTSTRPTYEISPKDGSRRLEESGLKQSSLVQQNTSNALDSAKSIRENVTRLKNELLRNEMTHESDLPMIDRLSTLVAQRHGTEPDQLQMENAYLMRQQAILSKSATLNEMLNFRKELEKSERKCEELSYQMESLVKTCDEKDRLVSRTLLELKSVTETCDTLEQQNTKLQRDLTLALEKLEEMTEEAERFAKESTSTQKQLADCEQKREESQIQAQEAAKQWTARVKKLEKDIDRYKDEAAQMLDKNEQLTREISILKSQESALREQLAKFETDLGLANTSCSQLEEHTRRNENDIIQLRAIRSSHEREIMTLKETVHELEKQLTGHRQSLLKTEKEKQSLQQLLQEETNQRKNLDSMLKQAAQEIEVLNTSHVQLHHQIADLDSERLDLLQKFKAVEFERDSLSKEKARYKSLESDYEEVKRKLEITKVDYTHGMKALQMDYENKIEMLQLQLSDEASRVVILQKHGMENKQEIDRLQDKVARYEDEAAQAQCTIEALSKEVNDKSRLVEEMGSKLNKLTVEIANSKDQMSRNDMDYQNSLQKIYGEIINCTECLSSSSNEPFTISEPAVLLRDDADLWLNKFRAHLAWLKQELAIRLQQERRLRQELDNAVLDCETDRKYFASELVKREMIINQLAKDPNAFDRETDDTIREFKRFNPEIDLNFKALLLEGDRDSIDGRYRQFQTLVDSVKRELHTAKLQLAN